MMPFDGEMLIEEFRSSTQSTTRVKSGSLLVQHRSQTYQRLVAFLRACQRWTR